LLLGLQAHHGSGLSSGWTLLGALVATQAAALYPIDENLCLSDVSAQRGCFQPHRGCSAVRAGDILSSEITEPYEVAAECNSVASPSQAAAAASIGPDPGPSYIRPELISGGNTAKSIAAQPPSRSASCW
jgi:hypothetical protein